FLAPSPEERGAQGHHQPGHPGQHLMRLGKVDRPTRGEGPGQAPRIERVMGAALERGVERRAGGGEGEGAGEVGRDLTPRAVARPQHGRDAAQPAPPEVGLRGGAGGPGGEQGGEEDEPYAWSAVRSAAEPPFTLMRSPRSFRETSSQRRTCTSRSTMLPT